MENNKKIFIGVLVFLVVALGITAFLRNGASITPPEDGKYDEFAMCLAEKGATFFGAFWCPHCKDQKKMFGDSQRLLKYVECSTPDGRGQTQACIERGVNSYPTWEFADGERLNGTIEFAKLAEKTGCELPLETIKE